MPVRIQLSRTRGWKKPRGAVVVSRPSPWGNPHRAGPTREEKEAAVLAFWDHLAANPELVARARAELRGKDLACWCHLPAPGQPDLCHARVLLEVANS